MGWPWIPLLCELVNLPSEFDFIIIHIYIYISYCYFSIKEKSLISNPNIDSNIFFIAFICLFKRNPTNRNSHSTIHMALIEKWYVDNKFIY